MIQGEVAQQGQDVRIAIAWNGRLADDPVIDVRVAVLQEPGVKVKLFRPEILDRCASAKRPIRRSISRVPRCQLRNRSCRRRRAMSSCHNPSFTVAPIAAAYRSWNAGCQPGRTVPFIWRAPANSVSAVRAGHNAARASGRAWESSSRNSPGDKVVSLCWHSADRSGGSPPLRQPWPRRRRTMSSR